MSTNKNKNTHANQSVLVTGALSGIGRAAALAFGRAGARVFVTGRSQDKGNALVAELRALDVEADFAAADVRRDDDMRKLVDAAVARFGSLDIAVNAAGTEGTPGQVINQTAESYAAIFETNVLGTLLSMKHELRAMVAQGRGSIVNVSSTYGHRGAGGASVYVASKHAVEGLTRSAAIEVAGSGVRVNAVAPGPIETEMLNRFTGNDANKAGLVSTVPLKRTGTPDEIAQAIVFLTSEGAAFVTGTVLDVDGGKSAA